MVNSNINTDYIMGIPKESVEWIVRAGTLLQSFKIECDQEIVHRIFRQKKLVLGTFFFITLVKRKIYILLNECILHLSSEKKIQSFRTSGHKYNF